MNSASSAMVNSVTITATGIEAVVETINGATNMTTNKVKSGYSSATKVVNKVITVPKTTKQFIGKHIRKTSDRMRKCFDYIIRIFIELLKELFTQIIRLTIFVIKIGANIFMTTVGRHLPDFRPYYAFRVVDNIFVAIVFRIQTVFNNFDLKIKIL